MKETLETWVRALGQADPLEEEAWQPTSVFLTGESHGQRSLAGSSPWGCKELDTTKMAEDRQCKKAAQLDQDGLEMLEGALGDGALTESLCLKRQRERERPSRDELSGGGLGDWWIERHRSAEEVVTIWLMLWGEKFGQVNWNLEDLDFCTVDGDITLKAMGNRDLWTEPEHVKSGILGEITSPEPCGSMRNG